MDDRNSHQNNSKAISTFAFSTPISKSAPDWKLILSSTDSGTNAGETIKTTDREISPIPLQWDQNKEKKNDVYASGERFKRNDASVKKDAKTELLASYNESSVLYNSHISNEDLFHAAKMNPLDVDSTSANVHIELNFQSMLKGIFGKETYDAKASGNKFTETFIDSFQSGSRLSMKKETPYLFSSNNEESQVLAENSAFTNSNECHLYFSSLDSSTKDGGNFSNISNSQVTDCSASIFSDLESPVLSEEFMTSVEKEKDNLEVEDDIYEGLPDILMSELPLVDEETCSSFPLPSNSFKNDTIQDDSNQNSLEIVLGANDKALLEGMDGLEYGGNEMLEIPPVIAIDDKSMNLNLNSISNPHKDRFDFRNFGRNPFHILSPITELSCENSAHAVVETNDIKISNVSSSRISESDKRFMSEKMSPIIGNSETCKVTELSPICTKKPFDSLAFTDNNIEVKNEEVKQDVKIIMSSLMIGAEAYKNTTESKSSIQSPSFTNTKKKYASPVIIKISSPVAAKLETDSTTKNSTVAESKIDVVEVLNNNLKNLPTTNSDITSINGNDRLIQDERMSISPDNQNINSKNESSPMEVSDATSSSYSCVKMADSSSRFHELNPLQELDNVNKTVANAVLKSMLELGNNKISIPQVLKYINQHKIMRVHSKLEKDVRQFFKVVGETGMLKKTKDHRYTLFGYKNNTPAKKNLTRATEMCKKSKNKELKSKAKALRSSSQKISARSHTKSITIIPKGTICRQLRNRTVLVKHK